MRPMQYHSTKDKAACSFKLDTKLRYLAEIVARDNDSNLSRYAEDAIRQALTVDGSPHLMNEGLWDSDPAKRLCLLVGAKPYLLNDKERRLWKRIAYMKELLNDGGALDINKLSQQWAAIVSQEGV